MLPTLVSNTAVVRAPVYICYANLIVYKDVNTNARVWELVWIMQAVLEEEQDMLTSILDGWTAAIRTEQLSLIYVRISFLNV